ncbi:MAG: hypothetical protein Crog4KO_33390 [Crocinitomicaceae bacterium]
MAFNGNEGSFIPLQDGAAMTGKYRDQNPNQIIGHFFGSNKLKQLMLQEGAVGLRMYYGLDEDNNKQLVLVAVDADQNDILDLVLDVSSPCPNWCSAPNPLNS